MSVDKVDQELAEGLGAAAARAGQGLDTCPYPADGSNVDRVLRYWWALGFAGDGGLDAELFGQRLRNARRRVKILARRAWYGPGDHA